MNLVIPYQDDGKDGFELRYAIRSMGKHFKRLNSAILVSDTCPSWYAGEFISYGNPTKRKEFNIYSKLTQVTGTVLYSNDDYYALSDFGAGLPNYYEGYCREKKPVDREYKDLYANCPGEWFNYDIHCPMIIDTDRFRDWPIDRPIKTAYANTNKLPGTYLTDCKIRHTPDYQEIVERIADRPFFSTHQNADRPGMLKLLLELYPKKSRFEY